MGEVLQKTWDERSWAPTETPGLDFSVLRPHPGGGATIFLKFGKGVVGAEHTHPGGEELFVVSGDITIGGRRLKTGDFLYTPPGATHDALAHEETVLLMNLPKLPVFL
ncbi:MAG TPA: cupin domain-containing protein [Caulobacteraceae bacterium]